MRPCVRPRWSAPAVDGGGECHGAPASKLLDGLRARRPALKLDVALPVDAEYDDDEEPTPESRDSRFTFGRAGSGYALSCSSASSPSRSVPRLRTELPLLTPRECEGERWDSAR